MPAKYLGEIATPLPDVVALDTAAGTGSSVRTERKVDERIAKHFFLIHLHAGALEEVGAGKRALGGDARVVGLVGSKAQFEGCGGIENMGPGCSVVEHVESAGAREVRQELRVQQSCVLVAEAEVESILLVDVVVVAPMEAVAIVGARAAGNVVLHKAWPVGQRRGQIEGVRNGRVDLRRGDHISGIGLIVVKRVANDGWAGAGEEGGKVAAPEFGRRNIADLRGGAAAAESLPTDEPEHLVFNFGNRAADGDAVLVLLERHLGEAVAVGEKLVRVKSVVA